MDVYYVNYRELYQQAYPIISNLRASKVLIYHVFYVTKDKMNDF